MKKSIVCFCLVSLISFLSYGQTQSPGDLRLHTIGTYGLRYKDFGSGAGIEYFFREKFALMPSYTRLFGEMTRGSNFSLDLRYYVSDGPSQLYFTAGYSHNWQNNKQPDGAGIVNKYVGANLGVGSYIRLTDGVGLLTELRFQSQNPQQVGFRFGFAFPL
jgi:hypothetical protein